MSKQPISRREFFTRTATAGAITAAAGLVIGACGGKSTDGPSCEPHGLSLADTQTRTMNKYTEPTPMKDKHCLNCQLYKPAADPKACGACTELKGSVSPTGYCQLWAEKKV